MNNVEVEFNIYIYIYGLQIKQRSNLVLAASSCEDRPLMLISLN